MKLNLFGTKSIEENDRMLLKKCLNILDILILEPQNNQPPPQLACQSDVHIYLACRGYQIN